MLIKYEKGFDILIEIMNIHINDTEICVSGCSVLSEIIRIDGNTYCAITHYVKLKYLKIFLITIIIK